LFIPWTPDISGIVKASSRSSLAVIRSSGFSFFSFFSFLPITRLSSSLFNAIRCCAVAPLPLDVKRKKDSYNKVLKDVKVEKFDRYVSLKMEETFHKEDFSMFG
jgi:hypothetical protein